jgi:hypothetical protein
MEVLPRLDVDGALQIAAGWLIAESIDEVLIGVAFGFDDPVAQFILHGRTPVSVSIDAGASYQVE